MILDLPPAIEQMIIDKAAAQGISAGELVASLMVDNSSDDDIFAAIEQYGLDSDGIATPLSAAQAAVIGELLDNPPPVPPAMRRLLALRGGNV